MIDVCEYLWVLIVPGVVLGIVLVSRSIRLPRGIQRSSCCGRCGYELRSLEHQICPECGVAHVHAGVSTPGLLIRHRGNYFLLWIGWLGFNTGAIGDVMADGAADLASLRAMRWH